MEPQPQPKIYTFISLWFLITSPIILWDAGFCLMRPRSMIGGDLHWFWAPYEIYQAVDLVYGVEAFNSGDGFANAAALMNIVETVLGGIYMYTAHVIAWPAAPLVGFTSASLTLAKTVLYLAQEYYCNYCAVGHNDLGTLLQYWLIPNSLWIIFPSLIVYTLGRDLVQQLEYADMKVRENRAQ